MTSANETVSAWLQHFEAALQARDPKAVTALFREDCFWRDLVSFTWNLKTMEGKAQIADMVAATLEDVRPFNWQREGDAAINGDVTESWITFETAVARGKGYLRMKNGKAWTLLTTMAELKGHEEKNGPRRD